MIKLAISGCKGRMGQRIAHLASQDHDFKIFTLLEHRGHQELNNKIYEATVTSDPAALNGADVLIEFTTPEATMEHLAACQKNNVKMVIGTTGLTQQQIQEIQKASQDMAIVFSSNMSVGVNILFKLVNEVSLKAPKNYSVRIVEAHHIHKKDAPSGTAKTIAEIIENARNGKVNDIKSIRDGEIIGDHEIILESPEDIITIKHHAKDRDIFAKGSLVAAKFLMTKNKGLFNMQDVLGLN